MSPVQEPSVAILWADQYSRLFYFIAKAMLDEFGSEGDAVLRQAIRDYGHFRARWKRARHEVLGLPINLVTLMSYGDMPGDNLSSTGRVATPTYYRSTCTACSHARNWDSLSGRQIGRIYCEEVHGCLYGPSYADGITLEMPEFMTKGDSVCTFILTMPAADPRMPEPPSGPKPSLERSMARLQAIIYEYLAQAMLSHFPDQGEQVLRKALREFAAFRGRALRQMHADRGWSRNVSTYVQNPDMPYGDSVALADLSYTADQCRCTVSDCYFYEGFREIEGERTPVGLIYCEEVHRGQAISYLGGGSLEMPRAKARSDAVCSFHLQAAA